LKGDGAVDKLPVIRRVFSLTYRRADNQGASLERRGYHVPAKDFMKSVSVVVLSLLVLALAGGGVYLAMWEIPVPKAKVEKVIPDERFPR
jgi:hypothetical protein